MLLSSFVYSTGVTSISYTSWASCLRLTSDSTSYLIYVICWLDCLVLQLSDFSANRPRLLSKKNSSFFFSSLCSKYFFCILFIRNGRHTALWIVFRISYPPLTRRSWISCICNFGCLVFILMIDWSEFTLFFLLLFVTDDVLMFSLAAVLHYFYLVWSWQNIFTNDTHFLSISSFRLNISANFSSHSWDDHIFFFDDGPNPLLLPANT